MATLVKRKRKSGRSAGPCSAYELNLAWAQEHVPDLLVEYGPLVLGSVAMERSLGALDAETVRLRVRARWGSV